MVAAVMPAQVMSSEMMPAEVVPTEMMSSSKIAVSKGYVNRRGVGWAIVSIRVAVVTSIRVMMSMPAHVDRFYLFSGEGLLRYNAGCSWERGCGTSFDA